MNGRDNTEVKRGTPCQLELPGVLRAAREARREEFALGILRRLARQELDLELAVELLQLVGGADPTGGESE